MAKSQTVAKKPAQSTPLPKKKANAVVPLNGAHKALAKSFDEMMDDAAGLGTESVGAGDIKIPRIAILQKLSPWCDRSDSRYIKGAKEGDIADTGVGELLDAPLYFTPVLHQLVYNEWRPREVGGIAAQHFDEAILSECEARRPGEKGDPKLSSGNSIRETRQYFGFVWTSEGPRQAYLSMSGSQLSVAKGFNTKMLGRKNPSGKPAPWWATTWVLETVPLKNAQGSWVGWRMEDMKPTSRVIADQKVDGSEFGQQARSFYDAVREQKVSADIASESAERASAGAMPASDEDNTARM